MLRDNVAAELLEPFPTLASTTLTSILGKDEGRSEEVVIDFQVGQKTTTRTEVLSYSGSS